MEQAGLGTLMEKLFIISYLSQASLSIRSLISQMLSKSLIKFLWIRPACLVVEYQQVAEGARLRRASKIIGADLNPDKFEIGKRFGVTDFINPATCGEKTVSETIKELTDAGADYCFECIGLTSLMNDAFSSSRQGWGKTVILGLEMHGSPFSVSSYEIINGRRVCGSLFGGFKPKSDIPYLVKKYLDKELNLVGFISHKVSFQDINKAFELLEEGKSLCCIVWMDH